MGFDERPRNSYRANVPKPLQRIPALRCTNGLISLTIGLVGLILLAIAICLKVFFQQEKIADIPMWALIIAGPVMTLLGFGYFVYDAKFGNRDATKFEGKNPINGDRILATHAKPTVDMNNNSTMSPPLTVGSKPHRLSLQPSGHVDKPYNTLTSPSLAQGHPSTHPVVAQSLRASTLDRQTTRSREPKTFNIAPPVFRQSGLQQGQSNAAYEGQRHSTANMDDTLQTEV